MDTREINDSKNQCGKSGIYLALIGIIEILVLIIWIVFTFNGNGTNYAANSNSFAYFFPHIIFLIVFITLTILFLKVFREISQKEEKRNEYERKKGLEKFQYDLYHAQKETDEMDALKKEVEALKSEFDKCNHSLQTVEQEKHEQAINFLALKLLSQDKSFQSLSIEDKMKQIENMSKLIKKNFLYKTSPICIS